MVLPSPNLPHSYRITPNNSPFQQRQLKLASSRCFLGRKLGLKPLWFWEKLSRFALEMRRRMLVCYPSSLKSCCNHFVDLSLQLLISHSFQLPAISKDLGPHHGVRKLVPFTARLTNITRIIPNQDFTFVTTFGIESLRGNTMESRLPNYPISDSLPPAYAHAEQKFSKPKIDSIMPRAETAMQITDHRVSSIATASLG